MRPRRFSEVKASTVIYGRRCPPELIQLSSAVIYHVERTTQPDTVCLSKPGAEKVASCGVKCSQPREPNQPVRRSSMNVRGLCNLQLVHEVGSCSFDLSGNAGLTG